MALSRQRLCEDSSAIERHFKGQRMKQFLKILGYGALVFVALALLASLIVLIGAQFSADAGSAVISAGDYEIAVKGLFDQPIFTILAAWLITAFAFFVAGIAVLFAVVVVAAVMGGVAFMFISPFILAGLIVWWLVRKSRNAPPSAPANTGGSTPPAAA
jgi:hypothetical protein